jgi:UDP-N-acetylmuramate--alanine ligase
VNDIRATGKQAFFVSDRDQLLHHMRPHLDGEVVLLLMGARDPSLEAFAAHIWREL